MFCYTFVTNRENLLDLTPTVTVPALRAAVETELSYRNDTIKSFSSQLTKMKTILNLLWLLQMFNSRILGLIWRGTAYSVVNDKTIFLPVAGQRSKSELSNATHFGAKLKAWRHKMFKFFPLLIWYVFTIINPFSWVEKASPSEKRCSTSMALSQQSDWHTNLRLFQGAWPDHVWVESFCFPRKLWVLFPLGSYWVFERYPPIGKRIWVGRYTNLRWLRIIIWIKWKI